MFYLWWFTEKKINKKFARFLNVSDVWTKLVYHILKKYIYNIKSVNSFKENY